MTTEKIDLSALSAVPKVVDGSVVAIRLIDCHNQLGEGVIFDDRTQTVLWSDIYGRRLHSLGLSDGKHQTFVVPKQLCSFGMLETAPNDLSLLCAWENGFQLYDVQSGTALSQMSSGEDVNPKKGPTRLNDGRVDPEGKFYICGGFYGDVKGNKMKVFRVSQGEDRRLSHTPIVDEIEVTNSISWSPDGKTMFLADSPTKEIHKHRYEAGTISEKTLVQTKDLDTKCVPDGSCVDSEGFLWNAVWRDGEAGSFIERIDPVTGKVVFLVKMPDTTSQVSCCCFGGKDLDTLFITSAAVGRDSSIEPHAGALYAVKLPFRGRPESRLHFSVSG